MAENTFWRRHIKRLHEILGEVLSNRKHWHGTINQLNGRFCPTSFNNGFSYADKFQRRHSLKEQ